MQTIYYVYSFMFGRYFSESGTWVNGDDVNIKTFTDRNEAQTVAESYGGWIEEETVYSV